MKNIKKILAAVLAFVMLFSFAGCHPKDEIAVTIGDVEFTSAYYMCVLMAADSEGQSKVYETLSDTEKQAETIDYESKKIDDKDFTEWVEDRAIEMLKEIAAYKILCKENGLELSEAQLATVEEYSNNYWNNGYSTMFEPNGVGKATYRKYMEDTYYSSVYFDFLYGKEGSKAIPDEEVKTKIYNDFVTVNVLTGSYESGMSEEQIAEVDAKMKGYYDALKAGTKTFKEVYMEHNNVTDEQVKKAEQAEGEKPLDLFGGVMGAKGTGSSFESTYYDTVKAMAVGEIKFIEPEDGSGKVILIKQDITQDPYYLTYLDGTVRHLLKDEEYEKDMAAYAKELKAEINDYALKQFKVEDIIEPSYE